MEIPKVEVWKEVSDSMYLVSNLGRIKNSRTNHILKQVANPKGYLVVGILIGKKKMSPRVHRLVAKAFIPNIDNKPQVNHKDGNKQRNDVNNLEWMTNQENARHAVDTGLTKLGKDVRRPRRLNEHQAKAIKRLHRINPNFKQTATARKRNLPRHVITDVLRGHSFAWVA